jgi:hypothetical protein
MKDITKIASLPQGGGCMASLPPEVVKAPEKKEPQTFGEWLALNPEAAKWERGLISQMIGGRWL